jgi:hypothetical protein
MFHHGAGFAHRHFAGQKSRHLLHAWRITRCLLQSQRRIGGKSPFATLATIPPRPSQRNGAEPALKTPLVILADSAQSRMTIRTNRRGQVGFPLRRLLRRRPQQFLAVLLQPQLDVSQILVARDKKTANLLFQTIGQARRLDR